MLDVSAKDLPHPSAQSVRGDTTLELMKLSNQIDRSDRLSNQVIKANFSDSHKVFFSIISVSGLLKK